MSQPGLMMVNDRTLFPEGFRRILESDFNLVGTAEDEQTLVKLAVELCPDAVLLDMSNPIINGLEAARQIRKRVPSVKLILVMVHSDEENPAEGSRIRSSAYLLKRSASSESTESEHQVLRRSQHIAPLLKYKSAGEAPALRREAGTFGTQLSDRERQVLQLIAEGHQAKEIAHVLKISHKTVEFHKQSIARKLSLRTTAELTRYAVREGLVEA
jgi:DNA-binding NarL/FixJ family response regulator